MKKNKRKKKEQQNTIIVWVYQHHNDGSFPSLFFVCFIFYSYLELRTDFKVLIRDSKRSKVGKDDWMKLFSEPSGGQDEGG